MKGDIFYLPEHSIFLLHSRASHTHHTYGKLSLLADLSYLILPFSHTKDYTEANIFLFSVLVSGFLFCISAMSQNVSWGDTTPTSTHPRQGSHKRPKYGYHRSPTCVGVSYRIMGEKLQNQQLLKSSCIIKVHPSMGDSSQGCERGALCTAHRQLNRLGTALC